MIKCMQQTRYRAKTRPVSLATFSIFFMLGQNNKNESSGLRIALPFFLGLASLKIEFATLSHGGYEPGSVSFCQKPNFSISHIVMVYDVS